MSHLKKLIFCCFLVFQIQSVFASDSVVIKCVQTPEIYDIENKPITFKPFNNLRRSAGSPISAKGELIYIRGRVTDINCVPIKNAVVSIWQANHEGIYQNQSLVGEQYDKNFSSSGQISTDNLGYYSFITIMPGSYNKKPPYIGFTVEHQDFISLVTKMFFIDVEKNHTDPQLKKMGNLAKLLIAPYKLTKDGNRIYQFNITLVGLNEHAVFKYPNR